MSDTLSKTQRLVIFKLLFTKEQPLQSKVRPELKPKERNELVELGLLQLEVRPRGARALVLTDRAWEWAADNLETDLMVSKYATEALEGVLRQLSKFLAAKSLALADLFRTHETRDNGGTDENSLARRIRLAYLSLSGNQFVRAVRIADLKAALPDIASATIDESLREMQQRDEVSLQIMEDPRQLSSADHAAAVRILDEERHLIYLER
jgi:hypothetical protein